MLLGVTTPQVSASRDSVIERGYLSENERHLAFAIPLMGEFVREKYARELDIDVADLHEPLLQLIAERRSERARSSPRRAVDDLGR